MANLGTITGRTIMMTVTRTAKTLGVALPAEVTAELTHANDLINRAENISGAKLNSAVLDALTADRDHHTDEAIQALLLDHILVGAGLGDAARERSDHQIKSTIVEHADAILTGWADALEPHSEALAAAVDGLPTHDLTNTVPIVEHGAEAMHHWASAQEALKRWSAAVAGFKMFAAAAQMTTSDKFLIMTPDDTAALERARVAVRSGAQDDAWLLAQHRVPLNLATLGEYMERRATAQQRRQLAASDAEHNRNRSRGDQIFVDKEAAHA